MFSLICTHAFYTIFLVKFVSNQLSQCQFNRRTDDWAYPVFPCFNHDRNLHPFSKTPDCQTCLACTIIDTIIHTQHCNALHFFLCVCMWHHTLLCVIKLKWLSLVFCVVFSTIQFWSKILFELNWAEFLNIVV